ncbi:outer membrane protein assembly factor BamD [Prevotella communis]|jgi:outer membrane protein assembly factor BamD|uniref:Beta-barrel assembly machine subunit BamD n=1 Tax=Prevotella communis TaxID=2913614 RepID=A0A1H0JSU1_9BACT|nr:outer membrane protein assembly factor BamD [Prevotella communis]UKK55272.1 outer membrane protein assembly factor BamD [Prevotella communis]UKK60689.1 outer membrane protein assembly factor BamD [Prevotella communis]UKK68685.1 outer membrane protein assembly factor BamD [Prevotella communis]UKK69180.1 outer membrane protein assembly factor BamD [Prevotella communis]SDG98221.1 Beta-barrel assembly machine subunit BamD [Prevotella communis]
MKIRTIILCSVAAMMTGCAGEFNRVIKSSDYDYRYEYAKQCFAEGKFGRAEILLQDLITLKKGTDEAEEALYMLAMSQYMNHDFESAAATFRKYFSSYPKGFYAEQAMFYVGQSLYESAPEPRLDQTPTIGAINAYQQFLDFYPNSQLRERAQDRLFELQDKLVMKELLSAQLYYNLGGYFGNINSNSESNYSSSIIVAQNALKTYPYSNHREEFSLLIMKSKFELAENSSADRKLERYQDAEDECYGFLNEYPESKDKALAEKYIEKCKKITKD